MRRLLLATAAFVIFGAAVVAAGAILFAPEWSGDELRRIQSLSLASLPPLRPDPSNRVSEDPAAAALGKALFFDTRLSANGAISCASCHKPDRQFQDDLPVGHGMSDGNSPNLAGQYPEVVIKQLHDYKRGDRSSAFMQTIAQKLADRDIEDVAAYYDSLPKARAALVRADEPGAPALVRVGDPLRNIVPCVACHGGIDHKIGAPWLEGMPKEYLLSQMKAFASGARRNDSYGQMRNMVRLLTSQELESVAEFYARREPAIASR